MTNLINISVDVDTLEFYANFAPNGIVELDPIMSWTMPKMLDLFDELGVKATFFVIGSSVEAHSSFWRKAAASGHEIASHSMTHPQAFHLQTYNDKKNELRESKHRIEDSTGYPVKGFRAPAYNIDPDVLNYLVYEGYTYDSSLFPGWFVPGSKLLLRLLNRDYKPVPSSGLHWQHRGMKSDIHTWHLEAGELLEFPLPGTLFGKPFIGTIHLNTSMAFFYSELKWLLKAKRFFTYELHPIEVMERQICNDIPWVARIPGVGKKESPWSFLRERLKALKASGKIVLLKDMEAYGKDGTYSRL